MSASGRATLRRYWRDRNSRHFQDDEAAASYAAEMGVDAGLRTIDVATRGPCTVLLGPPGAGKSTELKRMANEAPNQARLVSFGSTSSEDRLRAKIDVAVQSLTHSVPRDGDSPVLMLDSLDETSLTTTQLAGFIEDLFPELPERLRLVIACRSAAWYPGVEYVLRNQFEQVAIYDLAPLTATDIATYAASAGVDGAVFLEAVRRAKALPLAASPNTLGLLVDEFLAGGQASSSLPRTQTQLYERSTVRLVQEPNPTRQSPLQPEDTPLLLAVGGHMAVLSLFSGKSAFTLIDDGNDDRLSAHDCLPAMIAPYPGGEEVATTPELVARGLATALFTGTADGGIRFVHQTISEFLAARHLLKSGLSDKQLDGLLRGRGGLLAPQVQAVAAWLIALAPARFVGLLKDDPAAFVQSSVELTDPEYRDTLVAGLLQCAERAELPDYWGMSFEGLSYDGLEERLLVTIADSQSLIDARYLAIRIARANKLNGLLDALLTLSLDGSEHTALRNAGGHAILDSQSRPHIESLTVLVEADGTEGDADDELFGLGLQALLQSGTSPAALLPRLRAERNPDLFGNYRSVLTFALPEALQSPVLPANDLLAALDWAAEFESRAVESMAALATLPAGVEDLLDSILIAGLRRLGEAGILPAIARVIVSRIHNRHQLLHSSRTELPELPDEFRHALLQVLHKEFRSLHDVWAFQRSNLLSAEDLAWIVERAATATSDDDRNKWAAWIRTSYDRRQTKHELALKHLLSESPEYLEAVGFLLEPPQSPSMEDIAVGEDEGESSPPPTADELRGRLLECLSLDGEESFFYFCHWAQFSGGERYTNRQLELDIRDLPGWSLLTGAQQEQAVMLAERYLREAQPGVEAYLGVDRFSTAALAGVRALVLLGSLKIEVEMPDERWQFWAPVLVRSPFDSSNDDLLLRPLRQAYQKVPDTLLAAADQAMRDSPDFAQFTLRRLAPALTASAIPWLTSVIEDSVFDDVTAGVAFAKILSVDEPTGLSIVRAELSARQAAVGMPPERASRLIVESIRAQAAKAWPMSYSALSKDHDLAASVIGSLAHGHEFGPAGLTEDQIVELWELVDRLFPAEGDPVVRGAHAISVRESIGHFRGRLLPGLADRGTARAVSVLRQLAEGHPDDPSFRRLAAHAEAALRRSDWIPLKPAEILVALAGAKRVLRSDSELLEVVVEALEQSQTELRGATPTATLLWNHTPGCKSKSGVSCMPKSEDEISDFLVKEIGRLVPGVVVNREVQVTRVRSSGIGQRTDVLVEVPASSDSDRLLRVVIEVKGCWNEEIRDALENQLVTRYLSKWPGSAGIFLVAWFDPSHGAKPGTWLRDSVRGDREQLRRNLSERASAASMSSQHAVRAVILDCSMPT